MEYPLLDDITCPQELFEILTVSDRYEILDLANMASEALERLTITREDVIFTATVAKRFKQMYEDESNKLLVKCLKFIYDTTHGGGDIFALITKTNESFPDSSLDILQEMKIAANEIFHLSGLSEIFGWGVHYYLFFKV